MFFSVLQLKIGDMIYNYAVDLQITLEIKAKVKLNHPYKILQLLCFFSG